MRSRMSVATPGAASATRHRGEALGRDFSLGNDPGANISQKFDGLAFSSSSPWWPSSDG